MNAARRTHFCWRVPAGSTISPLTSATRRTQFLFWRVPAGSTVLSTLTSAARRTQFHFGASLQGRPSSSVDRFSPFRQPLTSRCLVSHLTSLSVFFALPCKASLEEPGVTSRTGFEGMQSLRSARRHHALPDEGKQQRVSLY